MFQSTFQVLNYRVEFIQIIKHSESVNSKCVEVHWETKDIQTQEGLKKIGERFFNELLKC